MPFSVYTQHNSAEKRSSKSVRQNTYQLVKKYCFAKRIDRINGGELTLDVNTCCFVTDDDDDTLSRLVSF